MCEHEQKYCPRCQVPFECKVGNILMCQCSTVALVQEERDFVAGQYDDCLCAACLQALKQQYHQQLHQEKLKKISNLFNK
jgi:hypothetical protein